MDEPIKIKASLQVLSDCLGVVKYRFLTILKMQHFKIRIEFEYVLLNDTSVLLRTPSV